MITRGSRAALVVLALLPALVACSGGSAPAPPPVTGTVIPPESSSTSPPTPRATASPLPTLPGAAGAPTRAGAEAFAEYFFAVYNYASWTADPEPLRAISDSKCVFCRSSIEAVQSIKAAKDRVEGGGIEVTTAAAAPGRGLSQERCNWPNG